MNAQVMVGQYENIGGREGVGSRGGYYNYTVRFPELWACDSVQRWLRKKQPTTRAEYLNRFDKFLTWARGNLNVGSPEAFLCWARKEPDGTGVQDIIDQYAETLSKSNAHIATALLRSFLGRNGYRDLPKIDWDSTLSFTEGYNRQQIQSLLGYLPSPLHKLYVILAKDSGLRANDLLYLRWKHIAKDYEAGKKYVHIEFEKERYLRRKAPGITFIGPNTITLIRQLIDAGTVKREPESKIFPFSYRNIAKSIDRAKKPAGINPEIQPSHGLRKFFENCLDRVGMDHHKKSQIEGHSNGVRAAYTSRDIDELRGLYEQAYLYLDLSEEAAADSRIMDLEKMLDEKTKHIEALKTELAQQKPLADLLTQIGADGVKALQQLVKEKLREKN